MTKEKIKRELLNGKSSILKWQEKKIVCERKSLLSKANVAKEKKELQVKIAKGFKGTFLKVITFSPLKMRIPWLSLVRFFISRFLSVDCHESEAMR